MASTIVFRRGSTFPSQGSGITLAEPVFNTNLNTFHIGLGHGVTAEWIGAPISGASASISSAEAYKIPTAKAVKDYVTDYVTAVNGVLAVNGFAGGVTLAAGTGVSVAASSGTITITNTGVQSFNGSTGAVLFENYVSSFNGSTGAVQGVSAAVAGTGISVSGATGAVTITNTGVQSFNGSTGAVQGVRYVNGRTGDIVILGGTNIGVTNSGVIVTVNNEGVLSVDGATGAINNVARTNTTNTFTQLQTFSNASGISAGQVITKTVQLPGNQTNLTLTGAIFSDSVGIRLLSSDGLGGDYHTTVKGSVLSADRTITFPDTTGTVALTSQLMGAVNGSTAATTAVTSFNGLTGAVGITAGTNVTITQSGNTLTISSSGGSSITDYVVSFNGLTGAVQGVSAAVAGTGISVSGATGAVTITNTGVQSFNGLTGAVGGVTTSVANTFTALQTFTTGISAAGGVTLATTLYAGTTAQLGSLDVRNGSNTRYMSFVPGPVNQIIAKGASSLNILHESFNPVYIGDYDAGNNGTYIEVDDGNAAIKFHNGGNVYTFPVPTGSSGQVLTDDGLGNLYWGNNVSTVAAGTGISVSGATGAVTITNTGVQSFNGSTGAVSFVNYVSGFNGSTGSVGISAGTGISITQSGTTYTIASTVSSGINRSIINVTGATTAGSASSTDYVYNGTSGPYAITLPTAVSNTNRYTIKNSGTGAISVYTTSSQTIDGITFYNLNKQYSAIDLMSDGSNWFIV